MSGHDGWRQGVNRGRLTVDSGLTLGRYKAPAVDRVVTSTSEGEGDTLNSACQQGPVDLIPCVSSPDHLKMIDLVIRRWAPLLLISVLILLALVTILLCVLWVRKRSSPADDPGVPPSNRLKGSQSKEVILNFKNEARVEPASDSTPESHLKPSPADQEEDENVQQERRWKIIYETTRGLYTIDEEDENVEERRWKIIYETTRGLYTIEEEDENVEEEDENVEETAQQGGSDVVLDVV